MSLQSNDMLKEALTKTNILQEAEKQFILARLEKFDHLDKFKLKRFISINDEKNIRETYKLIRDKIIREEKELEYLQQQKQKKGPSGILDKITTSTQNNLENPIAKSHLSDPKFLGHDITAPPEVRGQPFKNLEDFSSLDQLSLLDTSHVTFSLDDNAPLLMQKFKEKLADLFNDLENVHDRRGFFRLFMRSSLFNSYLNTGITALRHIEIQPRKIALNLIYQTDPIYLNINQFENVSEISKLLKQLSEI
ncbi:MAG: hypothetical protein ACRCXZ_08990 [Patescibacteria group bacterium]